MDEHQEEEREIFQLSDLTVEAIGLVRRPAVGGQDGGKKFYFIKSQDGEPELGGESMNENQEDFAATLAELAELKEVDRAAFDKLLSLAQGLQAQLAAQPAPEPEEPEPAPEEASEDEPDLYAEALNEAREEFAEKLAEERKAREEMAQKFAEERHKRRLAEFTETVNADFASLPIGEAEQFAEDLMAIHDADAGRHERLVGVLKAAQEAVGQGELFSQFSNAQPATGTDPFEAKVEAIRKERFSDLPADEGFAQAWLAAEQEHRDLASAYARKH